MELYFKYQSKVQDADMKIEKEKDVNNFMFNFDTLSKMRV